MLKTLKTLFKQDKEKFVIPKSVQAIIPIKTIWEDGIFLVGNNKYAKTFKFEDINYSVASREDKEAMFLEYSANFLFTLWKRVRKYGAAKRSRQRSDYKNYGQQPPP